MVRIEPLVWTMLFCFLALDLSFRKKVREGGIGSANKTFFHPYTADFCFAVTSQHTAFCGTGDCKVAKWNVGTSGTGRWQQAKILDRTESPVESLALSTDAALLLVCLEDNSLIIAQTSTMTIVSIPETLCWSRILSMPEAGLNIDPASPDCLVTNARLGCIQWVDPIHWKTLAVVSTWYQRLHMTLTICV